MDVRTFYLKRCKSDNAEVIVSSKGLMVDLTGFEPATSSMRPRRSSAELQARTNASGLAPRARVQPAGSSWSARRSSAFWRRT